MSTWEEKSRHKPVFLWTHPFVFEHKMITLDLFNFFGPFCYDMVTA